VAYQLDYIGDRQSYEANAAAIASLIAQVRKETLDALYAKLEKLEKSYAVREGKKNRS
jgi:ubiquinone biosynthesis protein UbiJ